MKREYTATMKKSYIRVLGVLVASVMVSGALRAQDFDLGLYNFSTGVDASRWVTLTSNANFCPSGDEAASDLQPIGFAFPLADGIYTQYSVNSNGTLKLGSSRIGTGTYSSPFSGGNANAHSPKIAGMGCDGYVVSGTHYVYGQTFGDSLLVVEFCEGTYSSGTRNQLYKWQVQLFKSGKVLIVYSPTAPGANPGTGFQVGVCMSQSDGWIVNSSHAGRHFTSGDGTGWNSGSWPGAGRYYCFEPPVVSCPRPYDLTASNVLPSGFTLQWSDTSGASSYKVSLLQGESLISEQVVNGRSHTFAGLDPSATYTLHVASICRAGDTSFWNWTTVETPCNAVTSLPYRYGFDDATASGSNGEINACWRRHAVETTTRYPYPDRSFSHEGDYSLHFASSATGMKSWVALPEMALPLNNLVVSFWALRTANTGGKISIGAIDYAREASSFELINSVQVANNNEWEYFEVPLSGYQGSKRYLTFMADAAAANDVYIDDVHIGQPTTCSRAVSYSVSNVATTSVTLNIVHPTEPRFTVVLRPLGVSHWDTIDGGASMPLGSLLPGTAYEGKIFTNCGVDTSASYLPFLFETACGSSVSLPVVFNAEGVWGGTATAPTYNCWNVYNSNGTYNWRQPNGAANAHWGEKSFYFNGTTNANTYFSMLMTPAMNFTGHEELTFWMRTSSTSTSYIGNLALYATKPGASQSAQRADYYKLAIDGPEVDTSTRTVSITGTTWKQYRVVLPDTLVGLHRLAFTVDMKSYTFFLDDIHIYTASTCSPVDSVVIAREHIMGDSAVVTWVDTNNAGNYIVTYWPETATSSLDSLYAYTTTPRVCLRGLQRGMLYYVSVTAQCGNVGSASTFPVSFQTECAPIAAADMPYQETFETYLNGAANYIDNCWYKMYVSNTGRSMYNYPYPASAAAIGGSAMGLYFHGHNNDGISSYAVLPEFELPYSDLMVEFDLKRHGTASNSSILYLGIMTDPSDASTFSLIRSYDLTSRPVSSVVHYSISLEGIAAQGRLAFFAPIPSGNNAQNHVYLDNVLVSRMPSCRWPSGLMVDSVGGTVAHMVWGGDASATYEMQVAGNSDFSGSVSMQSVRGVSGTFTGLTQRKHYYVRVRRVCGNDYSSWSDPVAFTTMRDCGSGMLNIIDTIGRNTLTDVKYAFYSKTGNASELQAYCSSIFSSQEMASLGIETNNLIYGISLHAAGTGGTVHKARIYMKEDEKETYSGNDTVSRASMTLVYEGDINFTANSWTEIPFIAPFHYSGTKNLVITYVRDTLCSANVNFYYTAASGNRTLFGWRNDESSAFNALTSSRTSNRANIVFDICTNIPNCSRPQGLSVASKTNTTLGLAWQGASVSYQVRLTTTPVNPSSTTDGSLYTTNTNSITLNGLTENTTYYYYVRGICGSDTSQWSVQGTVRTACNPQSVPYVENFERYEASTASPISTCWVKATNNLSTQYPYPYYTPAVTGSRMLVFNADHSLTSSTYSYAALPMFDEPLNTLSLSFAVRCGTIDPTHTTRLVIGVMSNPDNIASFEPYDTLDLHDQASNTLHGTDVYFNRYTGSGRYIAIYCETPPFYGANSSCTSTAYVDDVTVTRIPTCDRPVDVRFSRITHSTALVHWSGNAPRYEVEYGPAGFTQGQGISVSVGTDSLQLNMLNGATTYDVYVRARCSNTDVSNWSYVKSFATPCTPASLPMWLDPNDFPAGVPACWTRTRNNTADYPRIYGTSASYAHTDTKVLYYYITSSNSMQIMAFPELDAAAYPIRNCRINYWAKASRVGSTTFTVGAMTDPNDASTFVPIATHSLTTTVTEYTDTLSAYTGNGAFIAIKVGYINSSTYIYIDDISIEYVAPCATVFDLHSVGSSSTTADLAWTDTVSSTSWWVRYAPLGSDNWTNVPAGTIPCTLAGLQPNTTYQFRAASVCLSGETAAWSSEIGYFTTAQAVPAAMPYSYDFEDGTEWSRWQTSTNSSVNWARGTAAPGNATTTAYISLDGGATHSWDMLTRTNTYAYRDIDFGTTTGSFQVEFDASVGGTVDHDYDGLAVMLVDPSQLITPTGDPLDTPWGNMADLDAVVVRRDTSWGHYYFPVDNTSGVRRLVIYQFNRATGDTDPYIDYPPAIDNLVIMPQPCARPRNLSASDLTDRSATIVWEGNASARYIVAHRLKGTDSTANLYDTVVGNRFTITGLNASTDYEYQVVTLCTLTATDTLLSDWSHLGEFSTTCFRPSARDTIHESFESTYATVYDRTGELPTCWTSYQTGVQPGPHVTNMGNHCYWIDGLKTLSLVSNSLTRNFGPDNYVAMPYTLEPLNKLSLTFWYCFDAAPATATTLTVGYLTGDNFTTDFVPIHDIHPTTESVKNVNGYQTRRGLRDSVSFANVPNGDYRIAFRFSNPSTTIHSVCIDDIYVWYGTICRTPTSISVSDIGYREATISVTGTSTNFTLLLGTRYGTYTDTLTSNDGQFNLTGLHPKTNYYYVVRQECDSTSYSNWREGFFTTLELPCGGPSMYYASGVNFTSANLSWRAHRSQTQWKLHVFSTGFDLWDTVSGDASAFVGNLYPGTRYGAAVFPLCAEGEEAYWSDTTYFTTLSCPQATGINTAYVGSNEAVITWPSSLSVQSYAIEYGYEGLYQGGGVATASLGSAAVLEGLEPGTTYDVYVRSRCASGILGLWSQRFQFTTLGEDANPLWHTVSVFTNDSRYGTVSGGAAVEHDSTTVISASSFGGYRFVQWSDGDYNSRRTLTVTADTVLTACFVPSGNPTTFYTVRVVPNNPAWGRTVGGGEFLAGSFCPMQAVPAEGCRFVQWSDSCTLLTNSITVDANTTLTAIFTPPVGIAAPDDGSLPLNLYPNPATHEVMVEVDGTATVDLVDLHGRVVLTTRVSRQALLDLTPYARGTYFVRATGPQGFSVRKLIVR